MMALVGCLVVLAFVSPQHASTVAAESDSACLLQSKSEGEQILASPETNVTGASVFLQVGRQGAKETISVDMSGSSICTALANKGSYFSVELCAGTPPQCFDVVADTGSDSVIIPSCICNEGEMTGCDEKDKCFRGTNKSSTFIQPSHDVAVQMTFGSGSIEVVVATDVVDVGGLRANMSDGLLLMVNRAGLRVSGEFEGILGLGPPKNETAASLLQQTPGMGIDPMIICILFPQLCLPHEKRPDVEPSGRPDVEPSGTPMIHYKVKPFLNEVNVDRFSMCFRDSNQSGAFRMNLPSLQDPLANIGQMHWGFDFQGLSVGAHGQSAPSKIIFCGPETMTEGMQSPCGIIPDSGTTMMTGPEEQIEILFQNLCTQWPRCNNHATGQPGVQKFQRLLKDCQDWLIKDDTGLFELPSIFFHIKAAAGGQTRAFELSAWAWVVVQTMQSGEKVCEPAFSPMEYNTQLNGPIWIFGNPLFYEYDVQYDLSTQQMALKQGGCQPCAAALAQDITALELTDEEKRHLGPGPGHKMPREMHGKPRMPYYNVNLPL